MYEKMAAELERLGRTRWLDADFAALCDPATYDPNPSERWRRLKRVSSLSRRQLSAAQRLAEWRELRAMKIDSPRKWVLSDEQLVEACKREPRSIDELYMVRGMRDRLTLDLAREVLAAIEAGLDAPSDTWPRGELPAKNEANVDVELDVMNALVRLRARENGIAFQTLASHADLVAVARGYRDVDILRGWRRDIVGDELLELLDGKLALSFDYGSVKVTKLRQ